MNFVKPNGQPDPRKVTLGVIGCGTVGAATAAAWEEHVAAVVRHDLVKEKGGAPLEEVCRADLVFVCLPTPLRKDGTGVLATAVADCLYAVSKLGLPLVRLAVRSTVPVGFTAKKAREYDLSHLVHYPEFLTARYATEMGSNPTRHLIGVVDQAQFSAGGAAWLLDHLLMARFPGVPTHALRSDETELVKLATNAFFTTKLAFFNQLEELCGNRGLNWEDVRAAVLSDHRINPSHTAVPGPDGKKGVGGACLPKDYAEWGRLLTGEAVPGGAAVADLLQYLKGRRVK